MIVVGQEYEFTVHGNMDHAKNMRLAGLIGFTSMQGYDGLIVRVTKAQAWSVGLGDDVEQVWIEVTQDNDCSNGRIIKEYWWPSSCFKPIDTDFELVVGQMYVCHKKPNPNDSWGWSLDMDPCLGKPVRCMSVRSDKRMGDGINIDINGVNWVLSKKWIRPCVSASTATATVKRNLFNFWPTEGK